MYRQDALYAALLALVDDFEREAATATAEPPAAAAADCELGAAALADDLTLLRVTLERCAATASSGALEAARAARDRLAKREKKAKARQKKAVVAAAERPEVAGCTEKAGATRAEPERFRAGPCVFDLPWSGRTPAPSEGRAPLFIKQKHLRRRRFFVSKRPGNRWNSVHASWLPKLAPVQPSNANIWKQNTV